MRLKIPAEVPSQGLLKDIQETAEEWTQAVQISTIVMDIVHLRQVGIPEEVQEETPAVIPAAEIPVEGPQADTAVAEEGGKKNE